MDWLDDPVLSYRLVCDGTDPLTNAMVTARKVHPCNTCDRAIQKGERVRRETRRSTDGKKIITRHVCAVCCAAIARGEDPWIGDPAAVKAGDRPPANVRRPAGAPAAGEAEQ